MRAKIWIAIWSPPLTPLSCTQKALKKTATTGLLLIGLYENDPFHPSLCPLETWPLLGNANH
jgi:hypothetical protein